MDSQPTTESSPLIECPACSGSVSKKAWFCPHCGEPGGRGSVLVSPHGGEIKPNLTVMDGLILGIGFLIAPLVVAVIVGMVVIFLAMIGQIALT